MGLHQADIIKISDEEVDFLWGLSPQESAQKLLTEYGASLVYVTLGPKGCYFANRNCTGEIASPARSMSWIPPVPGIFSAEVL